MTQTTISYHNSFLRICNCTIFTPILTIIYFFLLFFFIYFSISYPHFIEMISTNVSRATKTALAKIEPHPLEINTGILSRVSAGKFQRWDVISPCPVPAFALSNRSVMSRRERCYFISPRRLLTHPQFKRDNCNHVYREALTNAYNSWNNDAARIKANYETDFPSVNISFLFVRDLWRMLVSPMMWIFINTDLVGHPVYKQSRVSSLIPWFCFLVYDLLDLKCSFKSLLSSISSLGFQLLGTLH